VVAAAVLGNEKYTGFLTTYPMLISKQEMYQFPGIPGGLLTSRDPGPLPKVTVVVGVLGASEIAVTTAKVQIAWGLSSEEG